MNISKRLNISTLKKKHEIREIMDRGTKVYLKTGLIFLFKKEDSKDLKAAFLIKKKIGNAVKRNYIKRVLRSILRENYNIFNKYNRIIFLYNYRGRVDFKFIESSIFNRLEKI